MIELRGGAPASNGGWISDRPAPPPSFIGTRTEADMGAPRLSLSKSWIPVTETGCWLWTGADNGTGYGRITVAGKFLLAHRAVYEALRGPIQDGMTIDHLCRIRCCVNPDHLEVVSMKVNILRGFGPTAINSKKRSCPRCGGAYSFCKGGRHCEGCNERRRVERRNERRAAGLLAGN